MPSPAPLVPVQSVVEDTLARISAAGGVEGFVIADQRGTPLRFSKSLSYEEAGVFASEMAGLVAQARGVVRDVDPRDELHYFRLRGRDREIMCATAEAFLVVVVQRWRPTPVDADGGIGGGAVAGAGAR